MKSFLRKARKDEQGNIFIMYIMMFTLMLGVVGLGADTAMNAYGRNSIQLAMDTATLTAATRTNTTSTVNPSQGLYNENTAIITRDKACTEVWNTYLKNRPGIATAGPVPSRNYTPIYCNVSSTTRNGRTNQYVEAQVVEYRKNTFLYVLGIKEQKFVITSRARLANSYEAQ